MLLHPKRIRKLLSFDDFYVQKAGRSWGWSEIVIGCASPVCDLFEKILIEKSSQKYDATEGITASVVLSIVASCTCEPIDESTVSASTLIAALGDESGIAWIGNRDAALGWEDRLAEAAPIWMAQLREQQASGLLDRTATLRNEVGRYVSCIREITAEHEPDYLDYQLRARATLEAREAADHISSHGCNSSPWYDVAALAIAMFPDGIEGKNVVRELLKVAMLNKFTASPARWLPHLIADRLEFPLNRGAGSKQ